MKILMVCLLGLMLTGCAAMPVNQPRSGSNTICMGVCFADFGCYGDCICVIPYGEVEGFCWNPEDAGRFIKDGAMLISCRE